MIRDDLRQQYHSAKGNRSKVTAEQYRTSMENVIYLASCAVNGGKPDPSRVADMDLDGLYDAAERHLLTAITAYSLENAGVRNERFVQAYSKAVRKIMIMDSEKKELFSRFSEKDIWYMPLKGSVIKELYPAPGLRQMSDFDILFDAGREDEVRSIMKDLGFSLEHTGSVHDSYYKLPVSNFELHKRLFQERPHRQICDYYADVEKRLISDGDGTSGRHMSDDDFYVYILAHEYKHYSGGGTGLRSLLDIYVFNRAKGSGLDFGYIRGELAAMDILEFGEQNLRLANSLFGGQALSEDDRSMLEYIYSSGTYGTVQNRVKNSLDRYGTGLTGKIRYTLSRIFIPLDTVKDAFPVFYRYPVLLPFLPVYRFFRGLLFRRRRFAAELRTLFSYRSKEEK